MSVPCQQKCMVTEVHVYVNNFPTVTAQKLSSQKSNLQPVYHKFRALTTAPSSHNVSVCRLLITNRQLLEYVKELKISGTDFILK